MTKQQRIVNMLRVENERAQEAWRHAHAERVGIDAAAIAWDEFNPQDGVGGFSQNPHNTNQASEREERARVYAAEIREAYEFAIDTFIGPA